MKRCDIGGCNRVAVCRTNGVDTCDRCRLGFVSVGLGGVHFDGSWHGVEGAVYTKEQADTFPGLQSEDS